MEKTGEINDNVTPKEHCPDSAGQKAADAGTIYDHTTFRLAEAAALEKQNADRKKQCRCSCKH